MELCDGNLQHSIDHPFRAGEKLFFLFDFTHNFKNIFNHFLNKRIMNLPTQGHEHILGNSCVADFSHISKLYAMEEDKSIKIAHQLKKVSLNPSNIARTSPPHALSKLSKSLCYASFKAVRLEMINAGAHYF